jgi:hypothetical protein
MGVTNLENQHSPIGALSAAANVSQQAARIERQRHAVDASIGTPDVTAVHPGYAGPPRSPGHPARLFPK